MKQLHGRKIFFFEKQKDIFAEPDHRTVVCVNELFFKKDSSSEEK